jgi:tetratricopeptide (TPR) repeat protein
MANQTKGNEDLIVDVEEVYSNSEKFINDNKNNIVTVTSIVVGIVVLFFGYKYLYLAPLNQEAKEQMWKAEYYFEIDSFNLAINGDGNYLGFLQIVDNYGSTKSGNLANYYLGISYYKKGDFQAAINYLKEFDADDKIISSVALGAIGDAYTELGNLTEALNYYKTAAKNDDNKFSAPIFLMKAGFVAEKLGNKEEAIELYKKLQKEYPLSTEARNVEKYLGRLGVN